MTTPTTLQPISRMSLAVKSHITTVLTDLDDTLTTKGVLTSSAYAALEQLQQSGIAVALITGRPAGWCDMIARLWPVSGVVGENGAFYYSYNRSLCCMNRYYIHDPATRKNHAQILEAIKQRILREVPGSAVSADQEFRVTDLAIDFCEDVPPLPPSDVERIATIFQEEGATARLSSIHVNGWIGNYDKLTTSQRFLRDILEIPAQREHQQIVFCGDSPNDETLFNYFPQSCGVANVWQFAKMMKSLPQWVTPSQGGQGFVELAQTLLQGRHQS